MTQTEDRYRRLEEIVRAHAPSASTDPDQVGCYRILERIGRGSAGEVFRAVDPNDHPVAVKVLDRRWGGARYARELEILERASAFEGVVPLLDAGVSRRGPYLVLELVPGGSLRKAMRERKTLAWDEALGLIFEVASTLRAIHEEGIVHRDLKPENLLLRSAREIGKPLISDFGLAKDLSGEDGELTQAGYALGTIGYMAPELFHGNRERLGPWTDVFALGALLYELISGRLPFHGHTLQDAARSIVRDGVRPLEVPPFVDAILARALAKETGERYRSGGELAGAIHAVLPARTG